jgi:hypothetical protein
VPSSYRWIPGTFEAEDFEPVHEDTGYADADPANQGGAFRPGEGVDIHAATDVGGGYAVGWTKAGEWMEYAWGNVSRPGRYTLRVRVASAVAGGRFHVEVGGVDVSGSITMPATGGAQSWRTLSVPVTLPFGTYKLRLVMDADGPGSSIGSFNHFSFDPAFYPPARPTPTVTATATATAPRARPTVRPTVRPTPTASIQAWQEWKAYAVNTLVTYGGVTYQCRQAHTSQPNWQPPNVPALWLRL